MLFVSVLAAGHASAGVVHFTPLPPDRGIGDRDVSRADLDADGRPDAVTCYVNQVRVYPGETSGRLGRPLVHRLGGADCRDSVVADLDGDDKLDVVVSARDSLIVLAGAGDGTVSEVDRHALDGQATSVATGDFDGDGVLDVAVSDYDNDRVVIFPGKGDGTFEPLAGTSVSDRPTDLDVGDFNQDGIDDLVVVAVAQDFTVLLGREDATPDPLPSHRLRKIPWAVAAGDLVGGPAIDLAIGWRDLPGVQVLRGDSQGHFTHQAHLSMGENSTDLALAQLDGDARLDIVVAESWSLYTYFGRPGSRFTNPVIYGAVDIPRSGGFTGPQSIATGDLDLDGRRDMLVGAEQLRVYLQRGRPYKCHGRIANVIGGDDVDDIPRTRRMPFSLIVNVGAGEDGIGTDQYPDVVCLGPGPDGATTYEGDDRIFAGPGSDYHAHGMRGADEIFGGPGDDELGQETPTDNPERGHDLLDGGSGDDKLNGGPGRDMLRGGRGEDRCIGGSGKDRAIGCEHELGIP